MNEEQDNVKKNAPVIYPWGCFLQSVILIVFGWVISALGILAYHSLVAFFTTVSEHFGG